MAGPPCGVADWRTWCHWHRTAAFGGDWAFLGRPPSVGGLGGRPSPAAWRPTVPSRRSAGSVVVPAAVRQGRGRGVCEIPGPCAGPADDGERRQPPRPRDRPRPGRTSRPCVLLEECHRRRRRQPTLADAAPPAYTVQEHVGRTRSFRPLPFRRGRRKPGDDGANRATSAFGLGLFLPAE